MKLRYTQGQSGHRFSVTNNGPIREYYGLEYEMPSVFHVRATGSTPCGDYDNVSECDSQLPSDATPIETVRKLTQPKPKVQTYYVSSPFDMGQLAALKGKGTKACKFDPLWEMDQHDEWMAGYETGI